MRACLFNSFPFQPHIAVGVLNYSTFTKFVFGDLNTTNLVKAKTYNLLDFKLHGGIFCIGNNFRERLKNFTENLHKVFSNYTESR